MIGRRRPTGCSVRPEVARGRLLPVEHTGTFLGNDASLRRALADEAALGRLGPIPPPALPRETLEAGVLRRAPVPRWPRTPISRWFYGERSVALRGYRDSWADQMDELGRDVRPEERTQLPRHLR